jgi:hypothetical protein
VSAAPELPAQSSYPAIEINLAKSLKTSLSGFSHELRSPRGQPERLPAPQSLRRQLAAGRRVYTFPNRIDTGADDRCTQPARRCGRG